MLVLTSLSQDSQMASLFHHRISMLPPRTHQTAVASKQGRFPRFCRNVNGNKRIEYSVKPVWEQTIKLRRRAVVRGRYGAARVHQDGRRGRDAEVYAGKRKVERQLLPRQRRLLPSALGVPLWRLGGKHTQSVHTRAASCRSEACMSTLPPACTSWVFGVFQWAECSVCFSGLSVRCVSLGWVFGVFHWAECWVCFTGLSVYCLLW